MPIYEYHCPECGEELDFACSIATFTEFWFNSPPKCSCNNSMRRRFSFGGHKIGFTDHYNSSLGEYVSSKGQMTGAFSRHSDSMSERLGMTVDYQPIDPRETGSATGVKSRKRPERIRDGKVTVETTRNPLNKAKVNHGSSESE